MTALYRVDCKLANHCDSNVRSEPQYLLDDAALIAFMERQSNKAHNDPCLLVYVINKWNGESYIAQPFG